MRNFKGFTLIELIVTIAVAAIIMAIAVPSMQTLRADIRVSSAAADLASDLKKSRAQAIMARRNQTLTAIDASDTANTWGNKGWVLTQMIAGNPVDVFKNQNNAKGVFINGTPTTIVFIASTGMVQTTTGGVVNMTFSVCDSKSTSETGYNVSINQFGRVLSMKHNNSAICNP